MKNGLPILDSVLTFVFLPILIVHIHRPDRSVPLRRTSISRCTSDPPRVRIYLILRTAQQVLPRSHTERDTAPSLEFGWNDR